MTNANPVAPSFTLSLTVSDSEDGGARLELVVVVPMGSAAARSAFAGLSTLPQQAWCGLPSALREPLLTELRSQLAGLEDEEQPGSWLSPRDALFALRSEDLLSALAAAISDGLGAELRGPRVAGPLHQAAGPRWVFAVDLELQEVGE